VNVVGDTKVEPNEIFALTLSNPSAGTTITTPPSTGTIQNDDTAPPPNAAIDDSYIATSQVTGRIRNMEHANASKTFFHDGDWFGVLPDANAWKVFRFDGPFPQPGTAGGWTEASPGVQLTDNNRNVDIAWDTAAQKLYILQYYDQSSKPILTKMGYSGSTHTFVKEAEAQLAGLGGKLAGAEWSKNGELALALDQAGNPLVAGIGPGNGGAPGLHLAYGTKDLSTWQAQTIDPGTTSVGENSKVDLVKFHDSTGDKVGLAYSAYTGSGSGTALPGEGTWKFAWHDAQSTPSGYGTTWQIETITDQVTVDNHTSAVSDGTNVYIAMKDSKDTVWLEKGHPGAWDAPVKVVNGVTDTPSHSASRPTLVFDETNQDLYVFYQKNVNNPYGDVYAKKTDIGDLIFNPTDLGTRVLQTYSTTEDFIDPQMPAHPVNSSMDDQFFIVAKNEDAKEVWYNDIDLNLWV